MQFFVPTEVCHCVEMSVLCHNLISTLVVFDTNLKFTAILFYVFNMKCYTRYNKIFARFKIRKPHVTPLSILSSHGRLASWRKWRACGVGKAKEGLENKLILQPFGHFTYVTAHSSTLPSLYLHHSSFSNPSVASPTSQFILQPFFRFSYVTSSSLNSPGEPSMTFVE